MPLTEKGSKILANMQEQYGAERGKEVFYASKNKGTISGVDNMPGFPPSSTSSVANAMGKTGTSQSPITDEDPSDTDTDTDDEDPGLIMDAEGTPVRRDEIIGDIPKEKAQTPKDKSNLPDTVPAARAMSESLAPVMPLSIKVGDQSLSNMNARNRSFWRR